MKRKIRHFLKSILLRILAEEEASSPLYELKSGGHILYEDSADIKKATFEYSDLEPGIVNIRIGKQSIIEGTLVLLGKRSSITIGNRVYIAKGTVLFCRDSITIDDDVMFSWGCTVIDSNAHSTEFALRMNDVTDWKRGAKYKDWDNVINAAVHIHSKCWIGFNSIILKGIELAEGTIVGAGSVVTASTSAFTKVGGNPAKPL